MTDFKYKNLIAIVAADNNWGIGYNGELLKKIPEDLKRFKELTINNVIIVGRKTLESFPNSKPLPNRINIVLTRNEDYEIKDAIVVHNLKELESVLDNYITNHKIFVAGGGEIYNLLLDYCNSIYVTKIHITYNNTDTFFPNIDNSLDWELIAADGLYNQHDFSFEYYKRNFNK